MQKEGEAGADNADDEKWGGDEKEEGKSKGKKKIRGSMFTVLEQESEEGELGELCESDRGEEGEGNEPDQQGEGRESKSGRAEDGEESELHGEEEAEEGRACTRMMTHVLLEELHLSDDALDGE